MIYIPTSEIKQPQLHADTLGFTFVWNGHFLRGVYPQSETLAKSYFESGFIDEVVAKGFFPNTWISEYENEMFGMIIEHEMISPVLYATEWNSAMLKDAALMVLDIAEIGWRYGYNMVDCHKLNVMFKNNHPVYVDLGSFITREKGSTGWKPYKNFLESYTYILDIWTHGCPQLAKRMMAPGVTFHTEDYLAWKWPFMRRFPTILSCYLNISNTLNMLAILGERRFKENKTKKLIKMLINFFRPSLSQRISILRKNIKRERVLSQNVKTNSLDCFIQELPSCSTLTCINVSDCRLISQISLGIGAERVISINERDDVSNSEYYNNKRLCTASFPLMNGSVLVREKFPEDRLKSEIVLVSCSLNTKKRFSLHNTLVFLEHCMLYSSSRKLLIYMKNQNHDFISLIEEHYKSSQCSKDGSLLLLHN